MTKKIITWMFLLNAVLFCTCHQSTEAYSQNKPEIINPTGKTVQTRFLVPDGYIRITSSKNSFGNYLQNLPLKVDGSKVFLYNGNLKNRQDVHAAVIDFTVDNKDLQQCADAVMRIHAEYLYSLKQFDKIAYNFVSDGKPRYFLDYSNKDTSYKSFLNYMNYVFNYANTLSLYNQLKKTTNFDEIQIGDVLIQTGNPYGHAVIVVDMAIDTTHGSKLFMLAQSYMPAQDIHIVKNKNESDISPWYKINSGEIINTPEWLFYKGDLRRF